MTDKNVALEAADILSLGSSFLAQGTPKATSQEFSQMIKANGDIQKNSTPFNTLTSFTAPYRWNADTGLGAALTSLLGSVSNAFLITLIRVETVFNDWPTINFTAHNHLNNAHAAGLNLYAVPADMIALLTGAFGAYDFAGKAAGDITVVRSTYEIRFEHVDAPGNDGNHWVGQNIKGEEEQTCEYTGNIATPTTLAGWTVPAAGEDDSNAEFDASSITATRLVLRT